MEGRPSGENPVQKWTLAEFVNACMPNRTTSSKKVETALVKNWREPLLFQVEQNNGAQGQRPFLTCPFFYGPCTFSCLRALTSEEPYDQHYHLAWRNVQKAEQQTLMATEMISTSNFDAVMDEDGVEQISTFFKVYALMDFSILLKGKRMDRFRRLVEKCLENAWNIEMALISANEIKQAAQLKRITPYQYVMAPRNLFDQKDFTKCKRFGNLYFHQILEESMKERRNSLNQKKAQINFRLFKCKGCAVQQRREHYHFVVDVIYQEAKELQKWNELSYEQSASGETSSKFIDELQRKVILSIVGENNMMICYCSEDDHLVFQQAVSLRFGENAKKVANMRLTKFFADPKRERQEWLADFDKVNNAKNKDTKIIPNYKPNLAVELLQNDNLITGRDNPEEGNDTEAEAMEKLSINDNSLSSTVVTSASRNSVESVDPSQGSTSSSDDQIALACYMNDFVEKYNISPAEILLGEGELDDDVRLADIENRIANQVNTDPFGGETNGSFLIVLNFLLDRQIALFVNRDVVTATTLSALCSRYLANQCEFSAFLNKRRTRRRGTDYNNQPGQNGSENDRPSTSTTSIASRTLEDFPNQPSTSCAPINFPTMDYNQRSTLAARGYVSQLGNHLSAALTYPHIMPGEKETPSLVALKLQYKLHLKNYVALLQMFRERCHPLIVDDLPPSASETIPSSSTSISTEASSILPRASHAETASKRNMNVISARQSRLFVTFFTTNIPGPLLDMINSEETEDLIVIAPATMDNQIKVDGQNLYHPPVDKAVQVQLPEEAPLDTSPSAEADTENRHFTSSGFESGYTLSPESVHRAPPNGPSLPGNRDNTVTISETSAASINNIAVCNQTARGCLQENQGKRLGFVSKTSREWCNELHEAQMEAATLSQQNDPAINGTPNGLFPEADEILERPVNSPQTVYSLELGYDNDFNDFEAEAPIEDSVSEVAIGEKAKTSKVDNVETTTSRCDGTALLRLQEDAVTGKTEMGFIRSNSSFGSQYSEELGDEEFLAMRTVQPIRAAQQDHISQVQQQPIQEPTEPRHSDKEKQVIRGRPPGGKAVVSHEEHIEDNIEQLAPRPLLPANTGRKRDGQKRNVEDVAVPVTEDKETTANKPGPLAPSTSFQATEKPEVHQMDNGLIKEASISVNGPDAKGRVGQRGGRGRRGRGNAVGQNLQRPVRGRNSQSFRAAQFRALGPYQGNLRSSRIFVPDHNPVDDDLQEIEEINQGILDLTAMGLEEEAPMEMDDENDRPPASTKQRGNGRRNWRGRERGHGPTLKSQQNSRKIEDPAIVLDAVVEEQPAEAEQVRSEVEEQPAEPQQRDAGPSGDIQPPSEVHPSDNERSSTEMAPPKVPEALPEPDDGIISFMKIVSPRKAKAFAATSFSIKLPLVLDAVTNVVNQVLNDNVDNVAAEEAERLLELSARINAETIDNEVFSEDIEIKAEVTEEVVVAEKVSPLVVEILEEPDVPSVNVLARVNDLPFHLLSSVVVTNDEVEDIPSGDGMFNIPNLNPNLSLEVEDKAATRFELPMERDNSAIEKIQKEDTVYSETWEEQNVEEAPETSAAIVTDDEMHVSPDLDTAQSEDLLDGDVLATLDLLQDFTLTEENIPSKSRNTTVCMNSRPETVDDGKLRQVGNFLENKIAETVSEGVAKITCETSQALGTSSDILKELKASHSEYFPNKILLEIGPLKAAFIVRHKFGHENLDALQNSNNSAEAAVYGVMACGASAAATLYCNEFQEENTEVVTAVFENTKFEQSTAEGVMKETVCCKKQAFLSVPVKENLVSENSFNLNAYPGPSSLDMEIAFSTINTTVNDNDLSTYIEPASKMSFQTSLNSQPTINLKQQNEFGTIDFFDDSLLGGSSTSSVDNFNTFEEPEDMTTEDLLFQPYPHEHSLQVDDIFDPIPHEEASGSFGNDYLEISNWAMFSLSPPLPSPTTANTGTDYPFNDGLDGLEDSSQNLMLNYYTSQSAPLTGWPLVESSDTSMDLLSDSFDTQIPESAQPRSCAILDDMNSSVNVGPISEVNTEVDASPEAEKVVRTIPQAVVENEENDLTSSGNKGNNARPAASRPVQLTEEDLFGEDVPVAGSRVKPKKRKARKLKAATPSPHTEPERQKTISEVGLAVEENNICKKQKHADKPKSFIDGDARKSNDIDINNVCGEEEVVSTKETDNHQDDQQSLGLPPGKEPTPSLDQRFKDSLLDDDTHEKRSEINKDKEISSCNLEKSLAPGDKVDLEIAENGTTLSSGPSSAASDDEAERKKAYAAWITKQGMDLTPHSSSEEEASPTYPVKAKKIVSPVRKVSSNAQNSLPAKQKKGESKIEPKVAENVVLAQKDSSIKLNNKSAKQKNDPKTVRPNEKGIISVKTAETRKIEPVVKIPVVPPTVSSVSQEVAPLPAEVKRNRISIEQYFKRRPATEVVEAGKEIRIVPGAVLFGLILGDPLENEKPGIKKRKLSDYSDDGLGTPELDPDRQFPEEEKADGFTLKELRVKGSTEEIPDDFISDTEKEVERVEKSKPAEIFLGNFIKLRKVLGNGGFGTIHKGYYRNSQNEQIFVAFKTFRRKQASDFYNEARILLTLNGAYHPNIMRLLALDIDKNTIILEYIEGMTLKSAIEFFQRAPFPESICKKVFSQVLGGINFLHQNGVVHRDLSSSNVMLSLMGGAELDEMERDNHPDKTKLYKLKRLIHDEWRKEWRGFQQVCKEMERKHLLTPLDMDNIRKDRNQMKYLISKKKLLEQMMRGDELTWQSPQVRNLWNAWMSKKALKLIIQLNSNLSHAEQSFARFERRLRVVKIIDFGSSGFMNKEYASQGPKSVLHYAAPETFQSWYCKPEVDYFALGSILFEMAEGTVWTNKLLAKTGAQHFSICHLQYDLKKNKDVECLAEHLIAYATDPVREIIGRLMSTNPRRRFTFDTLRTHSWLADTPIAVASKIDRLQGFKENDPDYAKINEDHLKRRLTYESVRHEFFHGYCPCKNPRAVFCHIHQDIRIHPDEAKRQATLLRKFSDEMQYEKQAKQKRDLARLPPTILKKKNMPALVDPTIIVNRNTVLDGSFGIYHQFEFSTGNNEKVVFVKKCFVQSKSEKFYNQEKLIYEELNKLFHPCIRRGWYFYDRALEIWMEDVSGQQLSAKFQTVSPFPEAEAKLIFADVLAGVMYLHYNNIAHRSLSDDNIIYKQLGKGRIRAKICDFSHAILNYQWQQQSNSEIYQRFNKKTFSAPETLIPARFRDIYKVDIWALGCLLFKLLHGIDYVDKNISSQALHAKILSGKDFIFGGLDESVKVDLSPEVKELIHCLMKGDPDSRATYSTIIKDNRWLDGVYIPEFYEIRTDNNKMNLFASYIACSDYFKQSVDLYKKLVLEAEEDYEKTKKCPLLRPIRNNLYSWLWGKNSRPLPNCNHYDACHPNPLYVTPGKEQASTSHPSSGSSMQSQSSGQKRANSSWNPTSPSVTLPAQEPLERLPPPPPPPSLLPPTSNLVAPEKGKTPPLLDLNALGEEEKNAMFPHGFDPTVPPPGHLLYGIIPSSSQKQSNLLGLRFVETQKLPFPKATSFTVQRKAKPILLPRQIGFNLMKGINGADEERVRPLSPSPKRPPPPPPLPPGPQLRTPDLTTPSIPQHCYAAKVDPNTPQGVGFLRNFDKDYQRLSQQALANTSTPGRPSNRKSRWDIKGDSHPYKRDQSDTTEQRREEQRPTSSTFTNRMPRPSNEQEKRDNNRAPYVPRENSQYNQGNNNNNNKRSYDSRPGPSGYTRYERNRSPPRKYPRNERDCRY